MIVERLTFDTKLGSQGAAIEFLKADRERVGGDWRVYASQFATGSKVAVELEFADHAEREAWWSDWSAKLPPEWSEKFGEAIESWNAHELWIQH